MLLSTKLKYPLYFLITSVMSVCCFSVQSQSFCSDENVFWLETFGTGTTVVTNPDVTAGSLTFQQTGGLSVEGTYRVSNISQGLPEWHNTPDHTANDVDGRMMVINGQASDFFIHTETRINGFAAGNYSASLFLINLNTPGTCAPNPLLPIISFRIEYLNANNNWVALNNSPVTTTAVAQSATPTWVSLGGVFVLPSTGPFVVTQLRIVITDNISGGCGNDYAIDDIKLATCPSGSPLPVSFLGISAAKKGSGAIINWATASEINHKAFYVERSNNNGTSWSMIATIPNTGNQNSQTTKKYQWYDAQPGTSVILYRIRQEDIDGKISLSRTVKLDIDANTTGITVLENPFKDLITVDFYAASRQQINASLISANGKQLLRESFYINKGYNRKIFSAVQQLEAGTYLMQFTSANGNVLYTATLVKLNK
jgi:hypothetical protein